MGILSDAYAATIAAYCQQYAQWSKATKVIEEKGTHTRRGGQRPEVAIANRAMTNVRHFAKALFLDPESLARIRELKPQKGKSGMRKILEEARKDH
jgi:phage terminase small subunit